MTQVSEVMTRDVRTLSPRDSIVRAAQAMDELDVGVIPVCEGDQLVGMVTDRDIVVRGLTKGGAVESTPLADVMTADPRWCFEDQSVDEVLEQMREVRIRRIAVFDHGRHLVGMLSLGDVAVKADGDGAAAVLQEISEPATPDRSGRAGSGNSGDGGESGNGSGSGSVSGADSADSSNSGNSGNSGDDAASSAAGDEAGGDIAAQDDGTRADGATNTGPGDDVGASSGGGNDRVGGARGCIDRPTAGGGGADDAATAAATADGEQGRAQ